jgi:hypothetical protein
LAAPEDEQTSRCAAAFVSVLKRAERMTGQCNVAVLRVVRFFKTADGVKVQELAQGSGEPAKAGDRILVDYVLRRANGYFIYGTVEGVSFQPRDVPTGPLELVLVRAPPCLLTKPTHLEKLHFFLNYANHFAHNSRKVMQCF